MAIAIGLSHDASHVVGELHRVAVLQHPHALLNLNETSTCVKFLIFIKMGQPRPLLSFIFGLFKQTYLQILQQINVKKVHPVYGAGIRTYDLRNTSLPA